MRTTSPDVSVRLYHLDSISEGGNAMTLFYGPLADAVRIAEQQPADVQEDLFIATDNDVVSYLDFIGE